MKLPVLFTFSHLKHYQICLKKNQKIKKGHSNKKVSKTLIDISE